MRRLYFDIEANGFLVDVTKVFVVSVVDIDTDEHWVFGQHELAAALELLASATVLVGHNSIRYDLPVLKKVLGFAARTDQEVLDTLILARLIFPNVRDTDRALIIAGKLPGPLEGKHTLEAWGYRIGEHKAQYEGGFEEWSQEMQDYCVQDTETGVALWRFLRPDSCSRAAIELEHRIARLCDTIERAGVPFDVASAGRLHAELTGKQETLEKELVAQFGSWLAPIHQKPAKSTFTPKKDNATKGYIAGATFTKLKLVTFNPGSRTDISHVLTRCGWRPTDYTPSGRPKIDESTIGPLVGQFPWVKGIVDYLTVDKRIGQLATGDRAWLKHVGPDGRIHGVINPMGTATSRAAHYYPNLGQVPAVRSPYGKECRALFHAPAGWVLVGADMGGLELRGLAHYLAPMDAGKYADVVVNADPHWLHVTLSGLVPGDLTYDKSIHWHRVLRDGIKRYMYAIIYGAGNEAAGHYLMETIIAVNNAGGGLKVPRIPDDPVKAQAAYKRLGRTVRDRLMEKIEGFGVLKQKIAMQVDRHGWVPGIDGRRVPARSEHSALNFLIQSAGAILCKRWGCDAVDQMESKWKIGWEGDFVPVLWVHDEYQVACRQGLEAEVGIILTSTARAAGEPYGFRVPLTSDWSSGRTWADTH